MLSRKSYGKLVAVAILIFVSNNSTPAQGESIYRLPAGTRITLRLADELSSRFSTAGDTFIAKVTQPVRMRDVIVVPVGASVEGRVSAANAASGGGHSGGMDLSFLTLTYSNGVACDIDGSLRTMLLPERNRSFGYFSVLGGAGVGAILGSLTGSGRNILIGTAAGAGAGAVAAAGRKGSDVSIGKNVEFEIELKKEVVLPVLDY
jgi:hypothetical protein